MVGTVVFLCTGMCIRCRYHACQTQGNALTFHKRINHVLRTNCMHGVVCICMWMCLSNTRAKGWRKWSQRLSSIACGYFFVTNMFSKMYISMHCIPCIWWVHYNACILTECVSTYMYVHIHQFAVNVNTFDICREGKLREGKKDRREKKKRTRSDHTPSRKRLEKHTCIIIICYWAVVELRRWLHVNKSWSDHAIERYKVLE